MFEVMGFNTNFRIFLVISWRPVLLVEDGIPAKKAYFQQKNWQSLSIKTGVENTMYEVRLEAAFLHVINCR